MERLEKISLLHCVLERGGKVNAVVPVAQLDWHFALGKQEAGVSTVQT